jgi:cobyrinic acid a,c-diamide synthase
MAEKDDVHFAFRIHKGEGIINGMDGLCYKNVLATYSHLHALGTNEWISAVIHIAIDYKDKNLSSN